MKIRIKRYHQEAPIEEEGFLDLDTLGFEKISTSWKEDKEKFSSLGNGWEGNCDLCNEEKCNCKKDD